MAIDLKEVAKRLDDVQKAKTAGVVPVYAADVMNLFKDATDKQPRAKALGDGARGALQAQFSACKALEMKEPEIRETLSNHIVYQEAQQLREALKQMGHNASEPVSTKKDEIDFEAMAAAKEQREAEKAKAEKTLDDLGELTPSE